MIAIDTNVLLRYLLVDDKQQFDKAERLIINNVPVLITDVVLAEAIWTLSGKRYGFDKPTICRVVRKLVGDRAFVFEDNQVIWSALRNYEAAKLVRGKPLDFADVLIAEKTSFSAAMKGDNLSAYYSFDKAVEQLHNAKIPE